MVSFKNVVLSVGVVSATLVRRLPPQAQADLTKIDTDVNKFSTDVNGWSGTTSTFLTVQNDYNTLDKDIQTAVSDFTASPITSAADCAQVVSFFTNTLDVDLQKAFTILDAHKTQIANAGLTSVVKKDLVQLQTDYDKLCRLLAKGCPKLTAECDRMDKLWAAIIADFS